ncbi:MAG: hypothetical protein EGQ00_01505 [Parabacteroides johnsonii]|nr:hypothetical protein [Parabacteroides johnsonii]
MPSASADGIKGLEAKPLPLWALDPFIYMYLKGVKPIEEPAKQEQSSIRLPKQTAKERLTAFGGFPLRTRSQVKRRKPYNKKEAFLHREASFLYRK